MHYNVMDLTSAARNALVSSHSARTGVHSASFDGVATSRGAFSFVNADARITVAGAVLAGSFKVVLTF